MSYFAEDLNFVGFLETPSVGKSPRSRIVAKVKPFLVDLVCLPLLNKLCVNQSGGHES